MKVHYSSGWLMGSTPCKRDDMQCYTTYKKTEVTCKACLKAMNKGKDK